MNNGQKHQFMKLFQQSNKEELETLLVKKISVIIKDAITNFGDARILFSGGSTPFGVYSLLSSQDLDWEKVTIGLVDERFVPNDDEESNYHSLIQVMVKAISYGATVIPMVNEVSNESKNLEIVKETYKPFFERIDFTLLGMGGDGHTASLFPNDNASENDLQSMQKTLISTRAPKHPKKRISCSSGLIRSSRNIFLMFTGEEKKAVFDKAKDENLPIYNLTKDISNFEVYFC